MTLSQRTRIISDNDMHVITTQFVNAITEIHIAMCLFSDDHMAQTRLNKAMHAVLVGAEQCRQLHRSPKVKIAVEPSEDEHLQETEN